MSLYGGFLRIVANTDINAIGLFYAYMLMKVKAFGRVRGLVIFA